ncbi:RNA polymerase-binding transcription factor DksA [Pseudoruegeria aquimaris]|uniref:RNA polymerase-binding transcription factor DksA n=1 Tax=Pseudoruegeria aquimaris TaxID=393663 RepID=A0A1Y5RCK8_9RHOB|nr:TraR/DksA family transcriptional regulator [Pseudoruegeria aquimaris]SLN14268.1 RNA polymerase-binding transcription factor DksA [Pseudoruegeria aquimaris]
MINLEERRAQLLKRKAELQERLRAIETELDSHQARDWEELATEREGDEVLEGIGVSGQTELRQLEIALKRIDEGEYGYCVQCGAEIAPQRLDLLPTTPLCAGCAAKAG